MGIQQIEADLKKWIDRQAWLGQVADPVQKAIARAYHLMGAAGQKAADFLNGVYLGHPLHPVLTDLAVGALTSAITLDALERSSGKQAFGAGADASLLLGVTSGLGAAVAGATDWQHTTGEAKRMGMLHALLNITGLILYIASLMSRRGNRRTQGRRLAFAGYLFSMAAAYLGGDLVYRQNIGVNHTPIREVARDFKDVIALEALPEEQLVRVNVDGAPVLLMRRGVRVFAIAEVCAHMGGPLSEGVLHSDNSVSCPWHGSRFDLETGRVLNGPSAYSQTCYQTRIVDGQIQVRAMPKNLETGDSMTS